MSLPVPKLATADVCDALGDKARVVMLSFRSFGGRPDFAGPAVTLSTYEDNSKLKELLATSGEGRVIVVDGAGSPRVALMGGNLAMMAAQNGWAGVIINGSVRDLHELCAEDVGIFALGSAPRKSEKQDRGMLNTELAFGGVVVRPGDWVVADADGVVVTAELPSL